MPPKRLGQQLAHAGACSFLPEVFFFLLLGVIPSICKDFYLSSEDSAILKDRIYHYSSASAANMKYVTPTVIQSMRPAKDIFS